MNTSKIEIWRKRVTVDVVSLEHEKAAGPEGIRFKLFKNGSKTTMNVD